ncbi:MAG: hypothetical protein GY817_04185 [bacterium]|nr:hypothetical protein [bacterium]
MKMFVTMISACFAIIIFIYHGKIYFVEGISLSLGNIVGSYIGTKFAITKGEKWIKSVFYLAVLGMIIKLLFFA